MTPVVLACLALLGCTATARASDSFEVAATGDVLTHEEVTDAARRAGGGWNFRRLFSGVRPLISAADLSVCQQETVIGPGKPRDYPRFRAPVALARDEARVGWDACSTASNHSFDYGAAGIDTTIEALEGAGIAHAGTERTRKASNRAHLIEVDGHRVALLAYAEFVNRSGYGSPGWQPRRMKMGRILSDARKARHAGAEAVIVNLHWGHDVEPHPGSRRIGFARELLSHRSVSAVIGEGPHLVWPVRFFHGKPAVLSTGNLLYEHDPMDRGWKESGIVALLRFRAHGGALRAESVRYVPLTERRRDLKLFTALDPPRSGLKRRIRHDYLHASALIGRGPRLRPLPAKPPP